MADSSELNATITARLFCEEDFVFHKKKEELALAARSTVAPLVSELGDGPCEVSFDSDGDIALESDNIFIYITRIGAICSAGQVPLSTIAVSPLVAALAGLIEKVHGLRAEYLRPISFGARLYTRLAAPTPAAITRLRTTCFSLSPDALRYPNGPTGFYSTCNYDIEPFKDTIEFEANPGEAAVRISRQAGPDPFLSFSEFWRKASLEDMLGRISWLLSQLGPEDGPGSIIDSIAPPTTR